MELSYLPCSLSRNVYFGTSADAIEMVSSANTWCAYIFNDLKSNVNYNAEPLSLCTEGE